jgi:glycosyltransferase involved in cell wall biosynthesis
LNLSSARVGIFLGSLHKHKRLEFLVKAADQIRAAIPNFVLLVVGDGPEFNYVLGESASRPWLKLTGSKWGNDKAACLAVSDLMLNPGLVGLNILDSFAAKVPLVTTDCSLHSPEIAYLGPTNGVMTENTVACYSKTCVELLSGDGEISRLREGCAAAAKLYSMDNMVERFTDGIVAALAKPARRKLKSS